MGAPGHDIGAPLKRGTAAGAVRYTAAVTPPERYFSMDQPALPHAARTPMRVAAATLLALLALFAAACGVSDAKPPPAPTATATAAASPTPGGPTATPTPDLAALLRDGGIAMIGTAYTRMLDEYITPQDPAALLVSAWAAMAREAAAKGVAMPPQPSFAGGRDAAFAAFRDAYVPLARAQVDPTNLRYAAIRGMAQSVNDCHTFFLSPVASDTLLETREGKGSVGIGVELAGTPPLVTEVITGGPAGRAGVLVGDRIATIDGAEATALGPAGALERINGAEGTTVRVQFRRAGAPALIDLTLPRERVVPPNVEGRTVGTNIGYVRIRNFVDGGIVAQLKEALAAFDAQGATGWIIDLRGNPGGRLDPEAISLFVKSGVIVRDRNRAGEVHEEQALGGALAAPRPTVLLTDHRTGSVAEVFAAALQEYRAAWVIGQTTNGCVGYTDIQGFGDGSSMAVTTHVNLGPVSGDVLNGVGVIPDQPVGRSQADIASARDPQLDAAITHLGG